MKLIKRKHIWLLMFNYSVVGNLFMVTSGAQTNSGGEKLRAGIGAYERGEYDDAVLNLEMATIQIPEENREYLWKAHLYLGLSHCLGGDNEDANKEFSSAQKIIRHKLPGAHRHSPKIIKLFKDASTTATVPGRGKAITTEETKFHRTGDGLRVSNDKVVSIEYTLKLADNTVQDSNVGKDPLRFVYGSNDIIPGLEQALAGMRVGDSKHVVVKPEDGYGPSDPEKLREISKDKLPPDAMVVGSQIQGQNASGKVINAWISEIKEDTAILNFNHRLAGQTLYFDVKVVDIKEME